MLLILSSAISTVRVLTEGTWCPAPPAVQHASVQWDNSLVMDPATYTCSHGYSFSDGSRTRTTVCMPGGKWLDVPRKCEGNKELSVAATTATTDKKPRKIMETKKTLNTTMTTFE